MRKAVDKGNRRASFADMSRALMQFGFKAQGFAASYEQLVRLKMPVIVYVRHRKDDHFSVLRGIDGDTVWLADPRVQPRLFTRAIRSDVKHARERESDLAGKSLAVLPAHSDPEPSTGFFSKTLRRQSAAAVGQLAHQV